MDIVFQESGADLSKQQHVIHEAQPSSSRQQMRTASLHEVYSLFSMDLLAFVS